MGGQIIPWPSFHRSYITAGGAETFLDQIITLKQRMVNDMGEEAVVYEELKDGPASTGAECEVGYEL